MSNKRDQYLKIFNFFSLGCWIFDKNTLVLPSRFLIIETTQIPQ